jgi:hypothetical protein
MVRTEVLNLEQRAMCSGYFGGKSTLLFPIDNTAYGQRCQDRRQSLSYSVYLPRPRLLPFASTLKFSHLNPLKLVSSRTILTSASVQGT